MELVEKVADLIDREALLGPGERCLVAVSGGADSLVLLEILSRLAPAHGWQLEVATFDHRWREDSHLAVELVKAAAARLGWPCHEGAAPEPCCRESGARHQRFVFLQAVRQRIAADRLALGHTADDRAETLLLNLIRGAGSGGLGAMPARNGCLIRPLLDARRDEVRAYAEALALPVVDDPSNLDVRFTRNRLRREIVPRLELIRQGAGAALARSAAICHDEAQALRRYGELLLESALAPAPPLTADLPALCLRGTVLAELPGPERRLLLRAAYRRVTGCLTDLTGSDIAHLEALALGRPDARPSRRGAVAACRLGPELFLLRERVSFPPWGPVAFNSAGTFVPEAALVVRGAEPCGAWPAGLRLRSRREGDRLRLPARGTRKVSDLLQELHVPRLVRDRVPLLVSDDQPIGLPGLAVGEVELPPLEVELTGLPGGGADLC